MIAFIVPTSKNTCLVATRNLSLYDLKTKYRMAPNIESVQFNICRRRAIQWLKENYKVRRIRKSEINKKEWNTENIEWFQIL